MTSGIKHRLLKDYLIRDAGYYPVVTLTGPRQSGKTTLAKAAFPSHQYLSLELIDQRRFAQENPRGFLAELESPIILDENPAHTRILVLNSGSRPGTLRDDRPAEFPAHGKRYPRP